MNRSYHRIKILGSQVAVHIQVRLREDLLHLLVSHVLTQLQRHLLEFLRGYLSLSYHKFTFFYESNEEKTLFISTLVLFSLNLHVAKLRNYPKFSPFSFFA